MINLGQRHTDNNKIINLNVYWVRNSNLGPVNWDKFDPINQLITLSVIPLYHQLHSMLLNNILTVAAFLMHEKSLTVITLGPRESDNIIRMKTISKSTPYLASVKNC